MYVTFFDISFGDNDDKFSFNLFRITCEILYCIVHASTHSFLKHLCQLPSNNDPFLWRKFIEHYKILHNAVWRLKIDNGIGKRRNLLKECLPSFFVWRKTKENKLLHINPSNRYNSRKC